MLPVENKTDRLTIATSVADRWSAVNMRITSSLALDFV